MTIGGLLGLVKDKTPKHIIANYKGKTYIPYRIQTQANKCFIHAKEKADPHNAFLFTKLRFYPPTHQVILVLDDRPDLGLTNFELTLEKDTLCLNVTETNASS